MAEAPKRRRTARSAPPPLDLALQGGGSHGAFTWGVLDRLLEDEQLQFDGVSGTSAGALNAAVLATGLAEGGRPGAQAALRAFWLDVAQAGSYFGCLPAQGWNPAQQWVGQVLRQFSPYQFNPLGLNPLRDLVQRHVRVAALKKGPVSVFVAATAVRTGQPRIFTRKDVSHDALMASACLPQLFHAVEIDGEPYWDGGYAGNPALWPLIYNTAALDLLLVRIDPLRREGTPDTAHEIADRVNEITFNANLVAELRAIGFVRRLIEEGRLDAGQYKHLRLHMVADDTRLGALPVASKLDTREPFLLQLHAWGRDAAEAWLRRHRRHLGKKGTLDVEGSFLPRPA